MKFPFPALFLILSAAGFAGCAFLLSRKTKAGCRIEKYPGFVLFPKEKDLTALWQKGSEETCFSDIFPLLAACAVFLGVLLAAAGHRITLSPGWEKIGLIMLAAAVFFQLAELGAAALATKKRKAEKLFLILCDLKWGFLILWIVWLFSQLVWKGFQV